VIVPNVAGRPRKMSVGTVEDISNTGAKSERLELLLSDQVTES